MHIRDRPHAREGRAARAIPRHNARADARRLGIGAETRRGSDARLDVRARGAATRRDARDDAKDARGDARATSRDAIARTGDAREALDADARDDGRRGRVARARGRGRVAGRGFRDGRGRREDVGRGRERERDVQDVAHG